LNSQPPPKGLLGGGCLRQATLDRPGKERGTASGTIEVDRQEGIWVLELHGEHDISTAPSLQDELERAYGSGSTVVVDLTGVEFMDSSALQGLLYGRDVAAQEAEHHIVLVVPADGVTRRLLTLTNFDELIPTYLTRADAFAALRS
jgi:anti-sigma B factor antagonist